jgi:hypothetical protein
MAMKTVSFLQTIFILLLILLKNFHTEASSSVKRILFFSPTSENNTYRPQVFKVLNAVAEDLNIVVETFEFSGKNALLCGVIIVTHSFNIKKIKKIRPNILIILCSDMNYQIDDASRQTLGRVEVIMPPLAKDDIAETSRRILRDSQYFSRCLSINI